MCNTNRNRWLVTGLLICAISAIPATAQQTFLSQTDVYTSANDLAENVDLSTIINDVRIAESLPLEPPVLTRVEWDAYAARLADALKSGHRGLQAGALRLIIAYGENFEFDNAAVFEVMRIYRDGDTENIRRMAVVSLAAMKSDFAMSYLERVVRFEKSENIRHTMRAILHTRSEALTSL